MEAAGFLAKSGGARTPDRCTRISHCASQSGRCGAFVVRTRGWTVSTPGLPQGAKVFTVADLTRQVKSLIEEGFPSVWVAGEVSNLSRPNSGHIYLTLKDKEAQIRAVMW